MEARSKLTVGLPRALLYHRYAVLWRTYFDALGIDKHVVKLGEPFDALLCLQLPYNSEAYKPQAKHFIDTFYGRAASIRMNGSAAMSLCYVAAGRLDGYAEQYIGQWDYMAGALIVMEAGGRVTNYDGEEFFMQGDSVVATNGTVHDDLMKGLETARQALER